MAKTIPQLTDATTVNAADELIIHQGGLTKRATAAELINNAPVTTTSTTTARPLADRFADAVNVKDFGAVGDGVADDAPAFQAAVNYLKDKQISSTYGKFGTKIYIPAGFYRINSRVEFLSSQSRDWLFGFVGDNQATTTILVNNQVGFLSLQTRNSLGNRSGTGLRFVMKDLTIRAAYSDINSVTREHSGTAITMVQGNASASRYNSVVMENVLIGIQNPAAFDRWQYGIQMQGGGRGQFFNVKVTNEQSGSDPADRYVGVTGIELLDHYGPTLQNCGVFRFDLGIDYSETVGTDGGGPEAGGFRNVGMTCRKGLRVFSQSKAGEPGLNLDPIHTNCRSYGVKVINRRFIRHSGGVQFNEGDAFPVSSITIAGGAATVTTATNHEYSTDARVVIAGATPSGLNGVQTITVTGSNTFTFATAETGAVTGTITAQEEYTDVWLDNVDFSAVEDMTFTFGGNPNRRSIYLEGVAASSKDIRLTNLWHNHDGKGIVAANSGVADIYISRNRFKSGMVAEYDFGTNTSMLEDEQLVVNHPTYLAAPGGTIGKFQIVGRGNTNTRHSGQLHFASGSGPSWYLGNASGNPFAPTTVSDGTVCGSLTFAGHDGTSFQTAAVVRGQVEGAVSTGVVPTNIQFRTTNAVGSFRTTTVIGYDGSLRPAVDANFTLGTASYKWGQIYSSSGTISTSDEGQKQDIEELSAAELRVAAALKGLIKKFRMRDAVALKGENARIHVGVIAQEVHAAFAAEGLDAARYGIWCYDEWPEQTEIKDDNGEVLRKYRPAGHTYGVRYDELLAFIIAAL
jgi:hypothetical protein